MNASVDKAKTFGTLSPALEAKIRTLDLKPKANEDNYLDAGKLYDLRFDGQKFILEAK